MAKQKHRPRPAPPQPVSEFEQVSPVWLLRALAITVGSIVLCLYLIYAGLFYFGQWQLVLHPSKTITQTPAAASMAFDPVRFGPDAAGDPQLTGWWIPAAAGSRYENFTVLYLHSGSGSLSDTLPALTELHAVGINLFAMEYRGFGASAAGHPSEAQMTEDVAAAFAYLTGTRHLLPTQLIPMGDGLGATLAARLAAKHNAMPVVILRNPPVNLLRKVSQDPRARILPMRMIFHERFEIAPVLATLQTPKLLIDSGPAADVAPMENLFRASASPKTTLTVSGAKASAQTQESMKRFLDQYLKVPPANLTPAM